MTIASRMKTKKQKNGQDRVPRIPAQLRPFLFFLFSCRFNLNSLGFLNISLRRFQPSSPHLPSKYIAPIMSDGAFFRDLMAYYDPDKQPIQEFRIIHSLVKDPNNASPDDAVKQILGLTNHHLAANRNTWPLNTMKGEFPWSVISLVMEIAAYTPFARQGKLLEFILRLQKNTVKDPRTNQGVKYNGEERIWNELPMLRVYVSDFWLFCKSIPFFFLSLWYVRMRSLLTNGYDAW